MVRYIISDASKRLNVEPHVLRYWEEELELDIPRNELGHRYYREEDIMALENIKALKDQGFQLKAIKMLLPNMDQVEDVSDHISENEKSNDRINEIQDSESNTDNLMEKKSQEIDLKLGTDNKLKQFQLIMKDMFEATLEENNILLTDTVSEKIIKQMDYLLRLKEEREEERFKRFDETLREVQKTRQEAAVTKSKKFKLFFSR
ncbi:MerR-like DNA binding protein [Natranaerovirga pectinivora]|uniref:MerR-like DNA binding protein n=1 Tax=Natranaerovirga pectinivora TaxID=682400 RepID=A0A4R3ML16_9FIRM|nr:helix-turn-helix domain-containing protein [Natranaerovirga pectinivora]TCT13130.1 MerR-like DNA binding protein [Natranaerovirga pectinivora]